MNMFASIAASGAAPQAAPVADSLSAVAQPQSSAAGPVDAPSAGASYSIGIDLGTTHCALSYVNKIASDGEKVVQGVLDIPQLTAN